MDNKGDIYTTEKPGMAERLSSRLSIHGASGEGTGGKPEFENVHFAGAIGSIDNKLQQIILGAKLGNFSEDRFQLREIVTRRSWDLWRKNHNEANINVVLNVKMADLVLNEYYLSASKQKKLGDTKRAKKLGVDPRRYKTQFKKHQQDLIAWLIAEETDGLRKVRKALKKQ